MIKEHENSKVTSAEKSTCVNLSRYTHLFERENRYFLYASLTNGFAELDIDLYDLLQKAYKHNNKSEYFNIDCGLLDKDDYATLCRMKAVNVDDDYELSKLRFQSKSHIFNPQILSLTINPTLACNFRCKYCFEKDHRDEFMSAEVEDGIVEYVKNHSLSRFLDVTWFGGEPLLAFKTVERLTEKLLPIKDDYKAGMISNGYLLTTDVCRRLSDLKISTMQITIDGSESTHNSRRFLKNGGGTYRRILENIDHAQKIAPEVRLCIRVNVDPSNAKEFVEVYRYFKEKHYPNLVVSPGYVVDIEESGTNSFCMMDEARIRQFLVELASEHGIYQGDFYPEGRSTACGATRPGSVVVGPKGELYRCWNDVGNKDREYGTIKGEITNEKVLYQYLGAPDQFSDQECLKCKLLPVCSGGCPYHRIMSHAKGTKYNSCPLVKSNLDDFLWMHYCEKTHKKFEPIK